MINAFVSLRVIRDLLAERNNLEEAREKFFRDIHEGGQPVSIEASTPPIGVEESGLP
ncbi:hypothetical protein ACWEKT_20020 [Nocardia takedensis]